MDELAHRIEEARHPQNNRKAVHCLVCDQYWTKGPRVYCPGVPVLQSHDDRYATKTQLATERLYPPDETRPDAAYRILNAPYYGWLYNRSNAIARPLTATQIEATAKREETIRSRYGCRFCQRWYTKKHHDEGLFQHGTCESCRWRIRSWNELLAACQEYQRRDIFVVGVETLEARPMVIWGGEVPRLTVTDIEIWPLSIDSPITSQESSLEEVRAMLRFMLDSTGQMPLLFLGSMDQHVVYHWLYPGGDFWNDFHARSLEALHLSHDLARPLPLKDWRSLDRGDFYDPAKRPAYYQALNAFFDLGMAEPLRPALLLHQIIQMLAVQEPLAFP